MRTLIEFFDCHAMDDLPDVDLFLAKIKFPRPFNLILPALPWALLQRPYLPSRLEGPPPSDDTVVAGEDWANHLTLDDNERLLWDDRRPYRTYIQRREGTFRFSLM